MDDFISIIRDSKNRDEARERLQNYTFSTQTAESLGILIRSQASIQGDRYVFTERQVNSILDLRLYQLTALENDKISGNTRNCWSASGLPGYSGERIPRAGHREGRTEGD